MLHPWADATFTGIVSSKEHRERHKLDKKKKQEEAFAEAELKFPGLSTDELQVRAILEAAGVFSSKDSSSSDAKVAKNNPCVSISSASALGRLLADHPAMSKQYSVDVIRSANHDAFFGRGRGRGRSHGDKNVKGSRTPSAASFHSAASWASSFSSRSKMSSGCSFPNGSARSQSRQRSRSSRSSRTSMTSKRSFASRASSASSSRSRRSAKTVFREAGRKKGKVKDAARRSHSRNAYRGNCKGQGKGQQRGSKMPKDSH